MAHLGHGRVVCSGITAGLERNLQLGQVKTPSLGKVRLPPQAQGATAPGVTEVRAVVELQRGQSSSNDTLLSLTPGVQNASLVSLFLLQP